MDISKKSATSGFLFKVRRFFHVRHRNFVFWRAMQTFMQNPSAYAHPGNPVLRALIYGWGNENWSALDEYLAACIQHALHTQGSVLECGSGLSTLLLGVITKQRGLTHLALEHSPKWAEKLNKYLAFYQLDSVVLWVRPLKDYQGYCWYELPVDGMAEDISLVVCDGPPSSTPGGRYGLISMVYPYLGQTCVVLLDDAGREQELNTAKRWSAEISAPFQILGSAKPYIEMQISKATQPQLA